MLQDLLFKISCKLMKKKYSRFFKHNTLYKDLAGYHRGQMNPGAICIMLYHNMYEHVTVRFSIDHSLHVLMLT